MKKQLLHFLLAFVLMLLHSCKDDEIARVSKVSNTGIVITGTSADASANIIDLSDAEHHDYGFCFSTGSEPTINDGKIGYGFIDKRKAYTGQLKNLSYNTTYYCRPYVMDDDEAVYGDIKTCIINTTQGLAVVTNTVNVTSSTTANVNATVTGIGSLKAVAFGVCYNTSGTPTVSDNVVSLGELGKDSIYNATLQGLDVMPDYFVRAFVKLDNSTIIYGNEFSFNISEALSIINSYTINSISSASINYTIVSLGLSPVTGHGICWGTSPNPTISNSVINNGALDTTGTFNSIITGLATSTVYHVRSFLITSGSIFYSNEISFYILPPIVATGQFNVTSSTNVTMGGSLSLTTPIPLIQHGHCYSTTNTNPTINDSYTEIGPISQSGNFGSSLTPIILNSQYYYRSYVSDGTNYWYGTVENDNTNSFSVVTSQVNYDTIPDGNGANTQYLGANASMIGGSFPALQRGFCWALQQNPTINDSLTTTSGSFYTGSFSSTINLSEFISDTTYYFRAYAKSGNYIVYGNEISFHTYHESWRQATSFTGQWRAGAVSFSTSTKGYITGGQINSTYLNDLWEFDPTTETWSQKANFPGIARPNASSFTINDKGYFGTGYYNDGVPTYFNDLWEYNPNNNNWSQKATLPVTTYGINCSGFAINNSGYFCLGEGASDFWEYNSVNDTWIQRTGIQTSLGSSYSFQFASCAFVINGKGIIVSTNNVYTLSYNPNTDSWSELAAPTYQPEYVGFSIGGYGYITSYNNVIEKYDLQNNRWTIITRMPGLYTDGKIGFSVLGKGYIGLGTNSTGQSSVFYEVLP